MLLCVPVLWLFVPGYGVGSGSSTRDKLVSNAPNNMVVGDLCFIGGMLLSGPAALHALRRATRPNYGFLAQLGMGSAFVPRAVTEKLELSKRRLRHSATALIALIVMANTYTSITFPMSHAYSHDNSPNVALCLPIFCERTRLRTLLATYVCHSAGCTTCARTHSQIASIGVASSCNDCKQL